eukprot:scaffold6743_cov118-Isochrysis_galbana.AAC.6
MLFTKFKYKPRARLGGAASAAASFPATAEVNVPTSCPSWAMARMRSIPSAGIAASFSMRTLPNECGHDSCRYSSTNSATRSSSSPSSPPDAKEEDGASTLEAEPCLRLGTQQPRPSGPQHGKNGLRASGATRCRHERDVQRQVGVVRADVAPGEALGALGENEGAASAASPSERERPLSRVRAGVGVVLSTNRLSLIEILVSSEVVLSIICLILHHDSCSYDVLEICDV